jgi:hypothetical protein
VYKTGFSMKGPNIRLLQNSRSNLRWKVVFVFVVVTLALILSLDENFLLHVGRFMAPEEGETAEVLILEGGRSIDKRLLNEGIMQLSAHRAERLILVIHRGIEEATPREAMNESYAKRLKRDLEQIGLAGEKFKIIETQGQHHPVTLTEAVTVLDELYKEGVRSAILETDGFHERRSYLVYKKAGIPLGIRITPSTYFINYRLDNWWTTRKGRHEFIIELAKLAYYCVKGYIR